MAEPSKHAQELLKDLLKIEGKRVRELAALVADRVDKESTDVSVDLQSGHILGALSDAARAAQYALAQRIIQKGGEDPGWGH
jgi:hypothetical protein